MTNLTSLASQIPVVGNGHVSNSKGVSIIDLLAQGIPQEYVGEALKSGVRLLDIPERWADQQRKERANWMQDQPKPALTLEQQIALLRSENERLKAGKKAVSNALKVSEKGAVSLYGIGRFPVTLYASQWEKLLAKADEIRLFMASHADKLSTKE